MRRTIPGLLLVATLGLSGLLTACGSDDADEPDTKDSTSQSSDANDADDTADTDDTADDNDAPEADGDKPDRDDVIEGYTKIVLDTGKQSGMEMPADLVNKVVTCFVDAVYDDASVATLEALEDGNAAGIDPADAKLFTDAQTTCTKSVS
ncbi:hypothetical protein FHP29_15990 [Nocardioides albidus]|uniref:DUF732 domain-containing protein n=1 Tax=Nocardioides albidus TaxID=1517589 RepID=A0A5C4VNA2_9ACTN|nr:hypothetical protein [Nocardioides albidus]TNM37342.1 hypothetical protein FHP29_15990 [Nocardioides albidus]